MAVEELKEQGQSLSESARQKILGKNAAGEFEKPDTLVFSAFSLVRATILTQVKRSSLRGRMNRLSNNFFYLLYYL